MARFLEIPSFWTASVLRCSVWMRSVLGTRDTLWAWLAASIAACTGGSVEGNLPQGSDNPTTDLGFGGGGRTLGDDDEDDPADRGWDPLGDGDADSDGDSDADGDGDAVDPVNACPDVAGCDVFAQCGCADGQACVTNDAGASMCAPAGTAGLYERCEGTGCVAGLLCLPDSQNRFTCNEPCDRAHACAEGECAFSVYDAGGQVIGSVCAVTGCPLFGGGCPAGQACSIMYNDTVCVLPGPIGPGGRCIWNEDCVAGSSCMYYDEADPSGICLQHCDPNQAFACPFGEICWQVDATTGVCDVG